MRPQRTPNNTPSRPRAMAVNQPRVQQQPAVNTAPRAPQAPRPPAIPRQLHYAFDAFDQRHMPLDEVSAPYTVTNFVNVLEVASSATMDKVVVVCPRTLHRQELYTGPLSDYIAMVYDANETIDGIIPVLDTIRSPIIGEPALTTEYYQTSVRGRLHNLSVKLECLGTNTGLYPPGSAYIGCVPCIETGDTSGGAQNILTVKKAWAEDSIQVGYIRSFAAASLVERPLKLNAAIAENVSYKAWRDFAVAPSTADKGSMPFSTALEPIVLYFPRCGSGTTVVNYRIVIGQQWCSRHPHNVMLRSTQKQHIATTPDMWHKAVSAVKDIGPQVADRMAAATVSYFARNLGAGAIAAA